MALALVFVFGGVQLASGLRTPSASGAPSASGTDAAQAMSAARAPAPSPAAGSASRALRWIVAGGGSVPELNQIQLEQDVTQAAAVLGRDGAPGLVLFAGGAGSRAVQHLAPPRASSLRARLAALFDPRGGRDSTYRPAALAPDGSAGAEAILVALEGALPDGDSPLTVMLAGHGLGGATPVESRLLTWGPADLWVEDVAGVLDAAPEHRPVRLVVTSCFGGGFAELAFAGADPERGAASSDRCGLFATSWDRTASGCDPNPDRGAQQGYTIHFLHALRGEDRQGAPLAGLDLDDDGRVSLLEAHTRARIASRSIDAPVTTSEVFVRAAVEPDEAEHPAFPLPEERAVIDALGAELGARSEAEANARIEAIDAELTPLAEQLDTLDGEVEHALVALNSALLHRWPLLDDPWHPEFEAALAADADAIERYLEESALAATHSERTEQRDALSELHDARFVELAMLERLARAHETRRLVAQLRGQGGTHWQRYQRFLACERGAP